VRHAHEASALKAGMDAKVIDVVRTRGPLTGLDEKDAAVIRFRRQVLGEKKMDASTALWTTRSDGYGGVMNTYAVSGFYAIAVDEHMPLGRPDPR
jgi:hypothetical protein